jgi:serine protease Do
MMSSFSQRTAAAALVLCVALAACTGDSRAQIEARGQAGGLQAAEPARQSAQQPRRSQQQARGAQPQQPTAQEREAQGAAARGLPDFAPLVEAFGPAVVNVEVVQAARGAHGLSPDDPLAEFFRRFGVPPPGEEGGMGPQPRGAGSGFIVSADGYILTNAHVVERADLVTVRLTDRREYVAEVVGLDERTDVAVIKIDAQDLPTVRIGDSGELRPGEWVLAIGSPFGFENSATAGIVSATARAVAGYVSFIQSDVAVNPGNSGGPLFNMRGEVVGINSMILSRTGGFQGVSFAIPIDVAMSVQDQLIQHGRVVRGRIGVTIQDVNAQLAESFGLDRPRGALVSSVEPEGPAAQAGLRPGDVILDVNGEPVERFGELSEQIANMRPGSQAQLSVWRDGRQRRVGVQVAELEEQPQRVAEAAPQGGRAADEASRLGLAVRPLEPQEREKHGTSGNLVVERVTGPAAAAGVRPGDVILGVNGVPVKSVKDLQELATKSGTNVALLIQRDEAQIFIPLRLG